MNNILSEKEYQRFIIDKLVSENGYIERKNVKFDRKFAIDREMLFKFLDDTQPEAMAQIRKVYKNVTEDTVVNFCSLISAFFSNPSVIPSAAGRKNE